MIFSLRKGGLYKHTIMDFIELLVVPKHLHKALKGKSCLKNLKLNICKSKLGKL